MNSVYMNVHIQYGACGANNAISAIRCNMYGQELRSENGI